MQLSRTVSSFVFICQYVVGGADYRAVEGVMGETKLGAAEEGATEGEMVGAWKKERDSRQFFFPFLNRLFGHGHGDTRATGR